MLNSLQLTGGGMPTAGFSRVLLKTTAAGTSTITVPDGVLVLKVKCWGACGQGFTGTGGGYGGFSEADIPVTPGEVLTHVTGSINGGGASFGYRCNGGGYSGLFRGVASQANALIVAGGGGGGGFVGSDSGFGGMGGGSTGQDGFSAGAAGGGGAGTQIAAGSGGGGADPGSPGSGMSGGGGDYGGGGSGYYGGGGGGDNNMSGYDLDSGGGGGGSGFTHSSALIALTQQGPKTVDVDYVTGVGIYVAPEYGRGMVVIRA